MGGKVGRYVNPLVVHLVVLLAGVVINLCLISALGRGRREGRGDGRLLTDSDSGEAFRRLGMWARLGDPSPWVTYRTGRPLFLAARCREVDATTFGGPES